MNKIAFLAIALMFLIGDSVADNPKPAVYESKPAAKVSREEPEFLIETSRDKVQPGQEFKARIWNDLPYRVQPKPRFITTRLEESGHRILEITPGEESITIIISHDVIHPTKEELEQAPVFGESKAAWIKWNMERAEDEHYHDSRTVLVEGDGPGPEPEPNPGPPDPPDDPIAKAVFDAALVLNDPKTAKTMGKIYLNVASTAAGLSTMSVGDMATEVKRQTKEAISAEIRSKWVPVGEVIDNLADEHATDRESAIASYNKFAEGLEAVK